MKTKSDPPTTCSTKKWLRILALSITITALFLIVSKHTTTRSRDTQVNIVRTLPPLQPPSQQWFEQQMTRTLSLLGYTPHGPPNVWKCKQPRHTYYFPKLRTVFTGIPKSGCTNWIEFLLRAEGALNVTLDSSEVDKVHSIYSNPFRLTNKAVREDANEASFKSDVYSFAVVRNPWTRLVSGYRDKLTGNGFGIARTIANEMNQRDGILTSQANYPTFNQYTRWLVDNVERMNDHFTPQHRTLCIPDATYNRVIPLEYSNFYIREIRQQLELTDMGLLGPYDSSVDPRNQSSALRAREWLSREDPGVVERLYRIFEVDFALMNYSNFSDPDFPLPLDKR